MMQKLTTHDLIEEFRGLRYPNRKPFVDEHPELRPVADPYRAMDETLVEVERQIISDGPRPELILAKSILLAGCAIADAMPRTAD
jgi:hypothetical protein